MRIIMLFVLLGASYITIGQDCLTFTKSAVVTQNGLRQVLLSKDNAHNQILLKSVNALDGDIDDDTFATLFYSSNIWAGGIDSDGEVRVAAGTYDNNIDSDWKPGPLDPDGEVIPGNCELWDDIFQVTKEELRLAIYTMYDENTCEFNTDANCDLLPASIINYPARGNSFFFDDPTSAVALQEYGQFFDRSGNGIYEPCDGDFPYLSVTGCENLSSCAYAFLNYMPKSFSFWITNDGGSHDLTGGKSLQLEVHHYTMYYHSRYKQDIHWNYRVINKGTTALSNFHFSIWADYDLGCYADDFAGVDLDNNGMYFYNQDAIDGINGEGSFCNGENTFDHIPMFGYKILRGLLQTDDDGNVSSSDMTSAVLQPRESAVAVDGEYFNLMNGVQPDGELFLDQDSTETKYSYTGNPTETEEWSMCSEPESPLYYDTKAVISTSCDILEVGQWNEVQTMLGHTIRNVNLPCLDFDFTRFELWQGASLYDNCYYQEEGPTAPNLIAVVTEEGIELTYDNNFVSSNNKNLDYNEVDVTAPIGPTVDNTYDFEGYKIYQVASKNFDFTRLEDESVSRLVAQSDIENDIAAIYNWYPLTNPSFPTGLVAYNSKQETPGLNAGLQETVVITRDALSSTFMPLMMGESYYFVAIAYAHNEWDPWNTAEQQGQDLPYLESKNNVKVTEVVFDISIDAKDEQKSSFFESTSNGFSIAATPAKTHVQLFDTRGLRVSSWQLNAGENLFVSYQDLALPSGIYILNLSAPSDGFLESHKLFVAR